MSTRSPNANVSHRTATAIWAAMLGAVVLYTLVGYAVCGAGSYEVAEDTRILLLLLAALALSLTAASFLVKRALLSKADREQRPDLALTAYIVAFAVAESAAIFGFIALLITGSAYSYLLLALGLFGVLLHKPGRDHFAAASYKNQTWG
ncbi:MAG TPA: hypothetical protein VGV38_05685 [Pyrinomonadaceae bacterium]|nr:hypothetical protein [Pyrinomonadaceae bacterium]